MSSMNNSDFVILQQLQVDISLLQQKYINWKMLISQLSKSALSKNNQNSQTIRFQQQIIQRLNYLHNQFHLFSKKTDDQLKNINQKQIILTNKFHLAFNKTVDNTKDNEWNDDQKYMMVTAKIRSLEESLRKTQENQNKLISTIQTILQKYQIKQQPSFIKNDDYLHSKFTKTSNFTFKSSHNLQQQYSSNPQQQALTKNSTINQVSESNIFLLALEKDKTRKNAQSNTFNYQQFNQTQPIQFIRTFAKNQHQKISLKMIPGHQKFSTNASSQKIRNSQRKPQFFDKERQNRQQRPISLDHNDHRFKFMMQNLK